MLKDIKSLLKANSLLLALFTTLLIAFLSLTRVGTVQPVNFKYLDKIEHGIAYMVLSFFWLLSLRNKKVTKLVIILFCIIYGVIMEVLQSTTSYRTFDYMDMIANSLGAGLGFIVFVFLRKVKKVAY